jgi:short-subunit dehydrogenase
MGMASGNFSRERDKRVTPVSRSETALITGASSGIGYELAKLFAADRYNLVLVARNEARLNSLAKMLREKHGVNVYVYTADLGDPAMPQQIYDRLQRENVTIDYLVNNAGFGARGAFSVLTTERQLEMIQVNVVALTHLTRLLLPSMLGRGCGGILNVASTAAFQPGPNMAVYYSTKAYVLFLSEALTEELSNTPLKVSCLAPGATQTGFAAEADMKTSRLFRLGAMNAEYVARVGYEGFQTGKAIIVPGIRNKLVIFLIRLGPRAIVRKLAKYLQSDSPPHAS